MPVVALDHIVLNVKDVERSLDFYQRCLGLAAERVDAWRSGQVRFPSVRINPSTIIDLVKDASEGGTRTNLAHFCLTTDSSDLEGIAEQLKQQGVAIEEGPKMRSGARGNALSIYFRDPDNNQIELRTYALRRAIQSALDEAFASLRAAMDELANPDEPMPGYDGWSRKDLIAHLTSVPSRIQDQVRCAVQGTQWTPEDIDVFNARHVMERRLWTIEQLRRECEKQAETSRTLLASLTEDDLQKPFDHPRRGRITVEALWSIIPNHTQQHLADLKKG